MATHDLTVFKPYDFSIGQKIRIEGGPRKGDWEVAAVYDHKVRLRCPFSKREYDWSRFCYMIEEQQGVPWPGKE